MTGLDSALAAYLRSWEPLRWREDCQGAVSPAVPAYVGTTFDSLATIETDSRVQIKKVFLAKLDSDPRIQQFIFPWLAEEAEHGRALRALGNLYRGQCGVHKRRDRRPSIKDALSWPMLVLSRPAWRYVQAAYCVLGMIQEHLALTVYRHLAYILDGQPGSATLRNMARQEGRHMRFYREAAIEFLMRPGAPIVARHLISRTWMPVGIEALGLDAWWRAFGPLMANPQLRHDIMKVDAILQQLPGFHSIFLLRDFFRSNAHLIERYERAGNTLTASGLLPAKNVSSLNALPRSPKDAAMTIRP